MKEIDIGMEIISSSGSGFIASYMTFPFEGYKKYKQQAMHMNNLAPRFQPYKGSTIFAVNIIPTTTIQLLTNRFLVGDFNPSIFSVGELAKSAYCGFQGALFSTMVENCITTQQRLSSGPRLAFIHMFNQGGIFRPWRSYSFIATRDGIFTSFMFQLNPLVRKKVDDFTHDKGVVMQHVFGNLAGIGMSVLGTALSHPFDTIATTMQSTDSRISAREAAAEVLKKFGSWRGFFVGLSYRFGLFFIFSNVIPFVKQRIDGYFLGISFKNEKLETKQSLTFQYNEKYEGRKFDSSNKESNLDVCSRRETSKKREN